MRFLAALFALTIATACSLLGASVANADPIATSAGTAAPNTGTHCDIVFSKPKTPDGVSQEISRSCTTGSVDPKKVPTASAAVARPNGTVLTALVTFYQYSDYNIDPNTHLDNGGRTTTLYGSDGPCDTLGYRFTNLTYSNDVAVQGISSYVTYNNCNKQNYWNQTSFGGTPRFNGSGGAPYLGFAYDDRLYSMKMYFQAN